VIYQQSFIEAINMIRASNREHALLITLTDVLSGCLEGHPVFAGWPFFIKQQLF
jgi:hypothetical protein